MDMNELYLVAVRLRGWEFMAEASHINANKAVRGLAEDLQDFYEEGQCSSAAHLMQQGAAAVGVAAIEDVQQPFLPFDQQALMSVMTTSISNTMTSAMTLVLQTNTAAFSATMNGVLQNHNAVMTALITKIECRVDDVEADADAKMAENKADADAKMAEYKADVDAKMAEYKAFTDATMAQTPDRAAGGVAAIEAVGQVVAPAGELTELEVAERRFDLKRKTEDWDQSLKERQMTLDKQKLELAGGWRIEIAAMKRPQ
jgi:hypothetical protein